MLSFLARCPGWAFTKDQRLDAAWGTAVDVNYHAVETMIYWIRRKIRTSRNVRIQTLVGYGYKLIIHFICVSHNPHTFPVYDEMFFEFMAKEKERCDAAFSKSAYLEVVVRKKPVCCIGQYWTWM